MQNKKIVRRIKFINLNEINVFKMSSFKELGRPKLEQYYTKDCTVKGISKNK